MLACWHLNGTQDIVGTQRLSLHAVNCYRPALLCKYLREDNECIARALGLVAQVVGTILLKCYRTLREVEILGQILLAHYSLALGVYATHELNLLLGR